MSYKKLTSDPEKNIYIADSAEVIADVRLAEGVSIWYGAVLRGDVAPIIIGKNSNIQDLAMFHTSTDLPVIVGENVLVGHSAILHGTTIGNNCLIGMGTILLDGSKVGEGCIIGAGALVTQGQVIPDHSLAFGSPARVVRKLRDEEIEDIVYKSKLYLEEAKRHFAE